MKGSLKEIFPLKVFISFEEDAMALLFISLHQGLCVYSLTDFIINIAIFSSSNCFSFI